MAGLQDASFVGELQQTGARLSKLGGDEAEVHSDERKRIQHLLAILHSSHVAEEPGEGDHYRPETRGKSEDKPLLLLL